MYKQRKFNLLPEASEGFGKVVCLLSSLTPPTTTSAIHQLKATVGYFNLDPNRVLSLTLDALSSERDGSTNVSSYVRVCREAFDVKAVASIVGFKLRKYNGYYKNNSRDPEGMGGVITLLRTISMCLKYGLFTWEDVVCYMDCDLGEVAKESKVLVEGKAKGVKKLGVVSLNKKEEEEKEEGQGQPFEGGVPLRLLILPQLISVNCYELFSSQITYLDKWGIDAVLIVDEIKTEITKLVGDIIEPCYAALNPERFGKMKETNNNKSTPQGFELGEIPPTPLPPINLQSTFSPF